MRQADVDILVLLSALATTSDVGLSRQKLVGLLWPDVDLNGRAIL